MNARTHSSEHPVLGMGVEPRVRTLHAGIAPIYQRSIGRCWLCSLVRRSEGQTQLGSISLFDIFFKSNSKIADGLHAHASFHIGNQS